MNNSNSCQVVGGPGENTKLVQSYEGGAEALATKSIHNDMVFGVGWTRNMSCQVESSLKDRYKHFGLCDKADCVGPPAFDEGEMEPVVTRSKSSHIDSVAEEEIVGNKVLRSGVDLHITDNESMEGHLCEIPIVQVETSIKVVAISS
ncbi:tyrosine kinase catalytic domain protein [Sesbania bispinosa]|nr:tyrosine kinase catalytic domain protein [Sesbania bispinosa]